MKTLIFPLIALAGITSAHAQAPGGVFQRYDTNGDGKVAKDELANEVAFQRYDLDKDGAISLAEDNQVSGKTAPTTPTTPGAATSGMAAQIENMIKAVDKNGPGNGACEYPQTQTQRVPFDMPVTSFMPHMHIRGAGFKYEVTYTDGKTETLLDIPRYDFNWQLCYDYKQPKLIPRGSTVKITAIYNNSASNKANPDPTQLVKWGPQTVDEMMLGYLECFVPLSAKVAMQ